MCVGANKRLKKCKIVKHQDYDQVRGAARMYLNELYCIDITESTPLQGDSPLVAKVDSRFPDRQDSSGVTEARVQLCL